MRLVLLFAGGDVPTDGTDLPGRQRARRQLGGFPGAEPNDASRLRDACRDDLLLLV
jgi:hypothetical protein